jgi:hypothetical protein
MNGAIGPEKPTRQLNRNLSTTLLNPKSEVAGVALKNSTTDDSDFSD